MKSLSLLFFSLFFLVQGATAQVDYADKNNWAVLPTNSVEIWGDLVKNVPFENVDIFYVYPTFLTSKKDDRWNYDISDAEHRKVVMNTAVKFQASAWAGIGKLYVPYYRQAHLRAYTNLEEGGREALLFAYQDVRDAFEYYMEHYNEGNAIILAGHSQGTTQLTLLMKEYFDGTPLQDKLIAAYLPGIGIDPDEFNAIPLMTSPTETGGFVSWNTFKRRYKRKNYSTYYKGKASINPITWDTQAIGPQTEHLGFLYSNGTFYKQSFETHLIDGGVWITLPRFKYRYLAILMPNYHLGDINLFWEDIRINARVRAVEYLSMEAKKAR